MSKIEIFDEREYSNKYSKNKYANKYSINIRKVYSNKFKFINYSRLY